MAVCLFAFTLSGRRWTVFTAGTTFALLHGLVTPLVYPAARIVGTVGPAALRVSAVVAAVLPVELLLRRLKKESMDLRYLIAAVGGNLVLVLFYWTLIYPVVGKTAPKPLDAAILLGATVTVAVLVAAVLSFVRSRFFPLISSGTVR
jgi:hypothetical protein